MPLWFLVTTTIVTLAGQAGSVVEQFAVADHFGKMRIVSDAALGRRPLVDQEIESLLRTAMKDADASVRRQAVGSLATAIAFSSWPTPPPGQEWVVRLRPIATALRPELDAAAQDPDAAVRSEAIRVIVGPFQAGTIAPGVGMSLSTAQRLASIFERDPSPSVRTLAFQFVSAGRLSPDPDVRRLASQVLIRALEQNDEYLVQAAGLVATQSNVPEALPLLVKQLKNPSHIARMGVAQGIASYRDAARPYLPELQAALTAETDDITRKTIAGTISLISR